MNLLLWSIAQLADELADGLAREARRLDVEQSVYGLDSLSELELHPVLERVFLAAGYGVFREQRYPAD
ncbi:MAG TPA: hypothetical protein VG711_03170, partial [Phycisphaerales bacterium]|nr:hypothetical protein [Phycisphaerales bacterium]